MRLKDNIAAPRHPIRSVIEQMLVCRCMALCLQ